jgi:hypothetical protein
VVALSVAALSAAAGMRSTGAAVPREAFVRWTALPRLPATGDYRYTLTARVRPLLVFWITRPDVGAARIVRSETSAGRSYELLIGSDPQRAPMGLNRWGYVAEATQDGVSHLIGVMTESAEQSVDQARAALDGQRGAQHAFKAIRATVADGAATAQVIRVLFDQDFTLRDVEGVLTRLPEGGEATARIRVPAGADRGFLAAVAELIHADVVAARATGHGARGSAQVFVYDRGLYDLTLVASRPVPFIQAGSTACRNCLASDYEVRNRATGNTTRFHFTYGTAGALAEVPVRIVYRPRWWFEAELTLEGRS